MANISLWQAKDSATQITVSHTIKDLDSAIRYLWLKVISDPHYFPMPFVRYGNPAKWAEGQRGVLIAGLNRGVIEYPVARADDYRVAYRAPEIPIYEIKFGELERRRIHGTYYFEHYIKMQKPEFYGTLQAKSALTVYPKYLEYLSYSIYKGSKAKLPMLEDYIKQYYEEENGSSEGYSMYGSGGKFRNNLYEAIEKTKITNHKFKEKLKKFHDKLYDNNVKEEIDITKLTSKITDKKNFKENVTSDMVKKFICMCDYVRGFIDKAIRNGRLDVKYKLDNTKLEGYMDNFNPSDYVLLIPMEPYNEWERSMMYMTQGTANFRPDSTFFRGVRVELCPFMDNDDFIFHHKDLIQMGFLTDPKISKSYTKHYDTEQTTDYITDFAHTCEMMPLYERVGFKLKAS